MAVNTGNWKGKAIKYRPGVIFVASKLTDNVNSAREKLSGIVDGWGARFKSFKPVIVSEHSIPPSAIFEVRVPFYETIVLAEELDKTGDFRFVDLDKVSDRSNNH